MNLTELRELLKDKRVIEEINKHLWIESQKSGYSIGIERATDEWLKLYAQGWLKYNKPNVYTEGKRKKKKKPYCPNLPKQCVDHRRSSLAQKECLYARIV